MRYAHLFTLLQLLLGLIKVKVDIQTLHKLCDGVAMKIALLGLGLEGGEGESE